MELERCAIESGEKSAADGESALRLLASLDNAHMPQAMGILLGYVGGVIIGLEPQNQMKRVS